MRKELFLFLLLIFIARMVIAQEKIKGLVQGKDQEPLAFAHVILDHGKFSTITDTSGSFELNGIPTGEHTLEISYVGFIAFRKTIRVPSEGYLKLILQPNTDLEEVVITGTMVAVSKTESPVPVEVYSPAFFRKNPSPSIYESLQNVNGVRPQLNCNVCNTGDIHINGLEGSYTMVLIDGMPIVSGLSSVYGLSGIPNSMIERVEIVKGPASSLYGSEAIGGIINLITKNPAVHPLISAEFQTTSWQEHSLDVGIHSRIGNKTDVLTGIHLFEYQNPLDNNGDNFTDVSLSRQLSLFQKWRVQRKQHRILDFAARLYHENRWGGEMQWTENDRGGDQVYGESIYTRRYELMSSYQLPFTERFIFTASMNGHWQDAAYGNTPFIAAQQVGFSQLTWQKETGLHVLVSGLALRYTYYDDSTPATEILENGQMVNQPNRTFLPGIFIQDEYSFVKNQKILTGLRYDRHPAHGNILTPRLAYKVSFNTNHVVRLNAGTGFRVVNVFTEDHAALTGAREVVLEENLKPEKSYNVNLNYVNKLFSRQGHSIGYDFSVWYSRFTNKILANYDEDPDLIVYRNLIGFSESKGVTLNLDFNFLQYVKVLAGVTYIDMTVTESVNGTTSTYRPVLTEKWSGTWGVTLTHPKILFTIDYTANLYGPMRLPLLGPMDPRPEYSPWWSIQNIQVSYTTKASNLTIFSGVKNFLNYTPPSNSIARAHDPFDEQIVRDGNGNIVPTAENPNAMSFDPSYVFAPNQGVRFYLGLRYNLEKLPELFQGKK